MANSTSTATFPLSSPTGPGAAGGVAAASSDDVLGTHDANGIARLVALRELHPREVVAATIERARSVEPGINAIVTEDFDRARESAESELTGAFAGLPMFVKDMTPVAGLRTGCGSDSMATSAPATRSAPLVQQFEAMGMVVLGKSSLPEYGLTCSTEFPDSPPTRNPWNLGHTAGGSSGGASALVAAGVVPMAHAADGGGSIRIPASACGLVGLKASRGRIIESPNDDKQPVSIGASGVVSRTVRDTCAFFAAAELLYHAPGLVPIGLVERPLDRPLNIGVVEQPPIDAETDAPTVDAVRATVTLLESLGHSVEPIASPVTAQFGDDFVLYWAVLAQALQAGGTKLIHPDFDAAALTDFTKGMARYARRNVAKVPGAIKRLRGSTHDFNRGLGRHDLYLSPVTGHLTPEIGHIDMALSYEELMPRVLSWACFTAINNATGTPAITLPLAHHDPTNLPIGMHFGARLGQERLLLELALQLEAAKPFRRNLT